MSRRDYFDLTLKRLNALLHPDVPWKATTAQWKQTDEFGVNIAAGEVYFRYETSSYSKRKKLSRASMETYADLLFGTIGGLESAAIASLQKREAETLEGLREMAQGRGGDDITDPWDF